MVTSSRCACDFSNVLVLSSNNFVTNGQLALNGDQSYERDQHLWQQLRAEYVIHAGNGVGRFQDEDNKFDVHVKFVFISLPLSNPAFTANILTGLTINYRNFISTKTGANLHNSLL